MESDWASECMAPRSMGNIDPAIFWIWVGSYLIQSYTTAQHSHAAHNVQRNWRGVVFITTLSTLVTHMHTHACWRHDYASVIDSFFCAATYCTSKEIHHWQIGWENQIHGSLSSMRALREVVTFFTHIKVLRKQHRFKTSMGTEYQKYWICSKMVPYSVSLVVLYQYNSCIYVHDAFWY